MSTGWKKVRRTVYVRQAKCRKEDTAVDYWSGASGYYCQGCPFFGGRHGSGGPSTDTAWCNVERAMDTDDDYPLFGATYEVWSEGARRVKKKE